MSAEPPQPPFPDEGVTKEIMADTQIEPKEVSTKLRAPSQPHLAAKTFVRAISKPQEELLLLPYL